MYIQKVLYRMIDLKESKHEGIEHEGLRCTPRGMGNSFSNQISIAAPFYCYILS